MTAYLVTHLLTRLKKNNISIETFLVNSGKNNWKEIMFTVVNIVVKAPISVIRKEEERNTYILEEIMTHSTLSLIQLNEYL